VSHHIVFGNSATASVQQQFQVFDPKGVGHPASITVVTTIDQGKLTAPILIGAHNIPDDCQPHVDAWARRELGLADDRSLFVSDRDPKESPARKLSEAQRLDLIAETLHYQLSWLEDCEDPDNNGWIGSAVETAGHQAACCLCQWFDIDGVPTSDTCDYLNLQQFPAKGVLRKSLELYLGELRGGAAS
jgi:hypothetical protein